MVMKAIGVALLITAIYLLFQSFTLVPNDGSARVLVYALAALFLVLVVRVLQAEKHHRDERLQARDPGNIHHHEFHLGSAGLPEQDSEPVPTSKAK